MNARAEAPPAGLGLRGRRLWNAVTADYEIATPDTRELLTEACRTLDRCEELEQAVNEAPATVVSGTGLPRVHPLLGELRQWRLTAARLLGQLGIPPTEAETADWDQMTASQRARKAARTRWDRSS